MPRATTAACEVMPPRVVRMPAAACMPGMSSGEVSIAHQDDLLALRLHVLGIVGGEHDLARGRATAPAYAQIERGFHGVRERAEAPRGLVRLTAPVALGRQQVVPHLGSFLRVHPEVRIELDLSDRLLPLAQEGVDLAIRHTAQPPDTHVAWLLCETRTLLVGAAAYLRHAGSPAHPVELAEHACLPYPRPGAAPVWSFENRKGERLAVPVRGPFAANNSEVLREAVLDGLGLALLPDFSAQAALRARKLSVLLPQWRAQGSFGERIYAIRPYSPVVPKAVRALVEHLRTALAAGFSA